MMEKTQRKVHSIKLTKKKIQQRNKLRDGELRINPCPYQACAGCPGHCRAAAEYLWCATLWCCPLRRSAPAQTRPRESAERGEGNDRDDKRHFIRKRRRREINKTK
jgi:hypothetical protein